MVFYIGKNWNEILEEFQKGINQIVCSCNIVWLELLFIEIQNFIQAIVISH